jgi:hypothetical protein
MNATMQRGAYILLMFVAIIWATQALSATAKADLVRTVQGEVVVVNLNSTPNVIVVKVILPARKELLVGVTVQSGAVITRGKQAIGLDGIQAGQTVSLTYAKNDSGLDARSIQVRK